MLALVCTTESGEEVFVASHARKIDGKVKVRRKNLEYIWLDPATLANCRKPLAQDEYDFNLDLRG